MDAEMTNEEKQEPSAAASQIEEKSGDPTQDKKAKAEVHDDDGTINLLISEIAGFKGKKSEINPFLQMLKKQYDSQDKKLDRVIRKEQELMRRLAARDVKGEPKPEELDAVEKELMKRDLEELVREEGEDVDFEFYFEGRPVASLSRTLYEMVRESEQMRRSSEKDAKQVEQLRVLQEREEELAKKARELSRSLDEGKEEAAA